LLMDAQWVSKMRDGHDPNPYRLEAFATLD
jgi:hypothetical protein